MEKFRFTYRKARAGRNVRIEIVDTGRIVRVPGKIERVYLGSGIFAASFFRKSCGKGSALSSRALLTLIQASE